MVQVSSDIVPMPLPTTSTDSEREDEARSTVRSGLTKAPDLPLHLNEDVDDASEHLHSPLLICRRLLL